jgi:hypothetical protein
MVSIGHSLSLLRAGGIGSNPHEDSLSIVIDEHVLALELRAISRTLGDQFEVQSSISIAQSHQSLVSCLGGGVSSTGSSRGNGSPSAQSGPEVVGISIVVGLVDDDSGRTTRTRVVELTEEDSSLRFLGRSSARTVELVERQASVEDEDIAAVEASSGQRDFPDVN